MVPAAGARRAPGIPRAARALTGEVRTAAGTRTFRALAHPGYRLWAVAALVSNTGTWMQRVTQDWLVLTDLTVDSALALGVVTGLQFAPMLLLAPWSGLIADRFDRRRVLLVTQAVQGALALVLGVLVVTGAVELWHVLLLAAGLGVATALDAPARQTFVSALVPPEDLPNAVSLNSATFHTGRLLGPAAAGLLIAGVGTGWVFLVNAATFAATLLALVALRRRDHERLRSTGGLRAGLAYVRSRPDLVMVLALVAVVGTLGLNMQLTSAVMARVEFGRGPEDFGFLGSLAAVGAVTGALVAARRERPRLRTVVLAALAFGVASTGSALMPTFPLYAVSLVPVGLTALTLMTTANAAVQASTPPELRGRVMALYLAIFLGGTPLGSPFVGWVGEVAGPRWTIGVGAIAALVAGVTALAWLVRRERVRVSYRRDPRPRLVVQTARQRARPSRTPRLPAAERPIDLLAARPPRAGNDRTHAYAGPSPGQPAPS
jgi:MFS family permease